MKAVDTNILLYAEISTLPEHERARQVLSELAEGARPWALPWPCVYELLRVLTHPKVLHPPMPLERALADVRSLLAAPGLVLLSETERHAETMAALLAQSRATGNLVHDAHIAALCLDHGVEELLTADRDFARFAGLRVRDPLTEPG